MTDDKDKNKKPEIKVVSITDKKKEDKPEIITFEDLVRDLYWQACHTMYECPIPELGMACLSQIKEACTLAINPLGDLDEQFFLSIEDE